MSKAEAELRQLNDAKAGHRLDSNGDPVLTNSRGIPYNYKSNLMMKILDALDKFMYRRQ